MKCNIAARTLLMVFVAAFLVSTAATAQAKHRDPCSVAGVAGDYGFTTTGTIVGIGPAAAVGRVTFEANGDITGSQTRSVAGNVADETITGTYTVNPDCGGTLNANVYQSESGVLVLVRTATLNLVWVDNEREIQAIFTSTVLQPSGTHLAAVLTIDAKRLFPEAGNQDEQ